MQVKVKYTEHANKVLAIHVNIVILYSVVPQSVLSSTHSTLILLNCDDLNFFSSQNSLIYNEETISCSRGSLYSVQPPLLRTTHCEISHSLKVQKLAFSNLSALQVEHPFSIKKNFGFWR